MLVLLVLLALLVQFALLVLLVLSLRHTQNVKAPDLARTREHPPGGGGAGMSAETMAALLAPLPGEAAAGAGAGSGASFAERSLQWTPVHVGVFKHAPLDALVRLLETHAAGAKTALGQTALHVAALTNAEEDVVELLAARGVDVNGKDAHQRTPLCLFCERRPHALPLSAVSALLRRGADPNAASLRRRTPLMACADRRASPELVEALVQAGARLEARDVMGRTALALALSRIRLERNMRYADWCEWALLLKLLSGAVQVRTLDEARTSRGSAAYALASRDGDRRILRRVLDMLTEPMPRPPGSRYF